MIYFGRYDFRLRSLWGNFLSNEILWHIICVDFRYRSYKFIWQGIPLMGDLKQDTYRKVVIWNKQALRGTNERILSSDPPALIRNIRFCTINGYLYNMDNRGPLKNPMNDMLLSSYGCVPPKGRGVTCHSCSVPFPKVWHRVLNGAWNGVRNAMARRRPL